MERNITVIAKISLVVITLLLSILPVHSTYVSSAQSGQEAIADFTWAPLEPNQKIDTVTFDGSSSTATDGDVVNWTWDFGDGDISALQNPTHTYANKGTYTVTLTVTNDNTSETVSKQITVLNDSPVADFTYTPPSPNILDTIQFTDTSTDLDGGIVAWFWDFNDGNVSTDQNPNHVYAENGTYTVSLTATDDDNETCSITQVIVVGPVYPVNVPPVADFNYRPMVNITTNTAITFTDDSTDEDGNISSWYWDFGDGSASNLQNPTHIYAENGTYTVTLTVTDDDNATDSTTQTVLVGSVPQPNVLPVADFIYYPMVNITTNTAITFTDDSTDEDGNISSWYWDFGDENISTDQNPSHAYVENGTYIVRLTVTDDDGATNSTQKQITIGLTNTPPVADFIFYQGIDIANEDEINITLHVAGKKYRLVNLTVYEDGVEVGFISVERIPGDPKEQKNTTKVPIDSSRFYIILLEYTPGTGDEDDDDDKNGGIPVWVTVECLDIVYEEHFVFHGSKEGDEGEKDENDEEGEKKEFNLTEILDVMIRSARIVKFDASASYDPDGEIVLHHWDFDDGNTYNLQNLTHIYAENGTYTVTLTVTDDDNATDSTTQTVLVGSVPPIADFSYDPMVDITIKMTILFTDHSTDIDGIISSWYWDFGDGAASNLQNPTHVYNRMGSYQVTLIVTDNDGQSNTKKSIMHIVSTSYDTNPDNIIEVTFEYNSNYIAWKGRPLNASDLAAYASLSYGDSMGLFDKKNGCWEEYIVGFSNASDDFLISTWDVVNIKCAIGEKSLLDISKIDGNAQNITLNFTYNPQTKEGNCGYNFFIWSKNQIITAKDLAENLGFSDENIAISKYFPDSNTWETYNPSLPVVFKTNFDIYPYDVVCVKLLKTSPERTLLIN